MEKLILVDKDNKPVGSANKLITHQLGLLHRAFSIFIIKRENNKIYTLLQKRNKDKYHSGGLWTNSCCGHPLVGESIEIAANRRLKEEFGFSSNLNYIDQFIYKYRFLNGLTEHELDHVFFGIYQEEVINPDPKEIEDFTWLELSELALKIKQSPQEFTVWLPLAYKIIENSI